MAHLEPISELDEMMAYWALVSTGEHLDRLDLIAVTGNRSEHVPVASDQIGEHLRVAGVGLRPGDTVAVSIPRSDHRVHREHLSNAADEVPYYLRPIDSSTPTMTSGRRV